MLVLNLNKSIELLVHGKSTLFSGLYGVNAVRRTLALNQRIKADSYNKSTQVSGFICMENIPPGQVLNPALRRRQKRPEPLD